MGHRIMGCRMGPLFIAAVGALALSAAFPSSNFGEGLNFEAELATDRDDFFGNDRDFFSNMDSDFPSMKMPSMKFPEFKDIKGKGSVSQSSSSTVTSSTNCNNGDCHTETTTKKASKGCRGNDCKRKSHSDKKVQNCEGKDCEGVEKETDCHDGAHCKKTTRLIGRNRETGDSYTINFIED